MTKKKSTTEDIEEVLQEIGGKIEELVKKGAEAGSEVKEEIEQKINQLTREMREAAKILEFEHAAFLRDRIEKLRRGDMMVNEPEYNVGREQRDRRRARDKAKEPQKKQKPTGG